MASHDRTSFELLKLSNFTTLRMGGIAQLYRPSTQQALVDLLTELHRRGECYHLLGNGSNLLVDDCELHRPVVHTELLKAIRFDPPYVEAEAGCLLPRLVREACSHNLGGIEYLISVPGTVGGGICMNAGRGPQHQRFLHQMIESVTCFDGKRTWTFEKSQLGTDFRWSIFRDDPSLCIVSARLKLNPCPSITVRQQIAERLQFARMREDHSGPNAGSVFRITKPFHAFRGMRIGGARFSEKTPNWIINDGATFREIRQLIRSVGLERELEWDVWF